MYVYPDYYKDFHCIADKCIHNCCIGWEIDIDDDTAKYYSSINDKFGIRLFENIDSNGVPHFVLDKNKRCPFLNENNLCDIMIHLGEDKVCEICAQHPRFYNEFEHHTECGIGLCCEEAARLVLGKKDTTQFLSEGNEVTIDIYTGLRNTAIHIMQDRSTAISSRFNNIFSYFNISGFDIDINHWMKTLLQLEILDGKWSNILNECLRNLNQVDFHSFDTLVKNREYEYEQFCVYLIYRHLATAQSDNDFIARIKFVKLAYYLLYTLGACKYTLTGIFTFDDQIELVRMFSSEIEYSEENINTLLNKLS